MSAATPIPQPGNCCDGNDALGNSAAVKKAGPRIGLLDSGISRSQIAHLAHLACARDFTGQRPARAGLNYQDRLGHGSTLAQVLIDRVPAVRLCIARIFDDQLASSAEHAAAGLDWLVEQGAQVINLSFGLRQDRQLLAAACQRALEAGVVLVASSPAVGAPVFPASYPGVIRATGDVRCQPGEHSWHPSGQADFGACVRAGDPRVVGASVASAYISACVGQYLCLNPSQPVNRQHLNRWLTARARYRGAQCPFALIPWRYRLTWDGAGAGGTL